MRAMLLLYGCLMAGCVSTPHLDGRQAERCVRMTFAYRHMTRDQAGPFVVEVDEGDPEMLGVKVRGRAGVLGVFRIWPDKRMEVMDDGQWKATGLCE